MKPAIYYYIVGVIVLGVIPFVPQMIGLRVRLLQALHLRRLANWHDRNRSILIPVVRVILLALGITLFVIGATV